MAGIKRKLDSTKGSAAGPTGSATGVGAPPKTPNSTVGDTAHIRVTRSLRASQDARANQTDNNKNSSNNTMHNKSSNNRPLSRIITLSTRAARANSAARNALNNAASNGTNSPSNAARETRASRTRAAAPAAVAPPAAAPSQFDGTTLNVPETPRSKRVRRGPVVEETPRSTRQSARLRSHVNISVNENASAEAAITKHFEASPSKGVTPSSRTRNRSRQAADAAPDTTQSSVNSNVTTDMRHPSPEDIIPETVEAFKQTEDDQDPHVSMESSQTVGELPTDSTHQEYNHETDDMNIQEVEGMPSPAKTSCSSGSRKRRSSEPENKGTTEFTSILDLPHQKLKLEDGELDHTAEQPLQGSAVIKNVSRSPDDEAEESKVGDESRQITEDIEESTPEHTTEPIIGKAVRGGRSRGRGRGGRSRAAARSGSSKRGRGAARAARGGRTGRQYDRSSDVEHDRSPSPSAATQKLRDRQRELDKAFRKVAAAQRLALAVLASQSQKKLSRDKNAHKIVPEYEEINSLLKTRLDKRLEVFRHEYELRVEQENRLFAANREAIEERFRASARYIKEEHFFASQGEYMAFVEGRRAAEDDEHTETDGSETEPERVIPPAKEVVRGFNSSFVRNPAGAASYDRARYGWDDFVQRAKLGDDIDPQMKEMREAGPFAGFSAREIIDLLLEATGIVEVRQKASVETQRKPAFPDTRPTALFALADVAAAELPRPTISQTTPRLSAHRALLPQPSQVAHGPTDPRSFVLPPPTPQRQQPRRLLPAGQQIPPISEQLGLPDPFASRGGPPQLPPPPGSNFQRPPLPNYLAGHHPQSLYYPAPPPPTAPPPPGPRPPY
ncbi:hypothetical protein AFCA_000599 [Aspergillus flavus]|nr:hypothetical protein NYO67_11759 [Aspergillus flavus]RAQ56380.1 hypothetical protein COH21_002439 [Aspergillus flavus]RAQ71998.1 hypothetical protein COH20_009723 [Aspergillus flavus]UCK57692.1 hypothetical protein AFCA_000599 [Aspergillus flavus]